MSLQDRIESLRARHQSLELALQEEIHRPLPNEDLIHDIKRQKLKIKDQIQLLAASSSTRSAVWHPIPRGPRAARRSRANAQPAPQFGRNPRRRSAH
jgi:hypothetical protein